MNISDTRNTQLYVCQISFHVRLCCTSREKRRTIKIVCLRAQLIPTDTSLSYCKDYSIIEVPETACHLFTGAAWVLKQLPVPANFTRQAILMFDLLVEKPYPRGELPFCSRHKAANPSLLRQSAESYESFVVAGYRLCMNLICCSNIFFFFLPKNWEL
jgi:hypothetical protein